uniref:hypothetical protein n=1 Tax=Pedobacter schmidteae TaxID=2201271 RepID=UPI000EB3308B|nr:hypothetical protein [Pedobacter schmidteae]
MKTIKNITTSLLLIILSVAIGCKKDPVVYSKGFEAFKFIVKNTQGEEKEYPGIITGDEIVVALPIEVDVTNLKASFVVDNPRTIVQVGTEVQESGISENDFTNALSYSVKAEDKSRRNYTVRVEKKIAMQSFGFYAADNPGLEADYIAIIRGTIIDIVVPETIDLSKLVARFQTTAGVTLKIGTVTQESKITPNNFASPVTYTFTDASLPAPILLTVNLSFIGPKWWLIGDKSIIGSEATDVKMAIHPFTKQPYLAYIRTGKDESGSVIQAADKKIAVIALAGTTWKNIGSKTGVSDTQADIINIAFDEEGTPYVGYKDYLDALQKATVLKYTNDSWTAVGPKNFSPMRVDKFSFTVGENSQPLIGASTFTAITGYLKRAIYASNYSGNKWNDITPAMTNNLIGGVQVFKGLDAKSYMAVLDRNSNFSMYKLTNNTWAPVGPIGFRTADGLPGYTSVIGAASANGTVYIGFQTVSANQRLNRIMKFNGSAWEELGSAGNSQDQTEKYALAIAPNGQLYFGFANTTGLYVRTFNDNTKNWNTPRLVFSGRINTFDLQVASDGIPYLAVSPSSDNKVIVYKYSTTK